MVNCSGMRRVASIILFFAMTTGLPYAAEAATIKAETVRALVSNHIEKSMPWSPEALRIEFLTKIADIVLPQDIINLEVQNRPDETFIGETFFTVKYLSEGTLVKEEMLRVRLEVQTSVVVSSKALAKDREITAEDVVVQKKWVRRMPTNVVTTLAEVLGKVPTYNLSQNQEITQNCLKTPLLIKRGNIVRISLNYENLTVTAMGISEEDGAADKIIRVKNLSSNKTIYARVVDDSLVKVEISAK